MVDLTPEIVTLEPKTMAAMPILDARNIQEVVAIWKKFVPLAMQLPNRIGSDFYAPRKLASSNIAPSTTQHWAAVLVSSFNGLPPELEQLTIEGGTYAVFVHKGITKNFMESIEKVYAEWLPQSGYQLGQRLHFDRMGEKYLGPENPQSEEEIWIPIH